MVLEILSRKYPRQNALVEWFKQSSACLVSMKPGVQTLVAPKKNPKTK
jgi:hypothetical protein